MSFIDKKVDTVVLRAKLTDKGRELLSKGLLNYRYWSVGDTEVDYNQQYDLNDGDNRSGAMVLAPKDQTLSLKYPLSKVTGGDQFNIVTGAQSILKEISGASTTKGFFNEEGTEIVNDYIDNVGSKKHFKGLLRFTVASLNGTNVLNFATISGLCEIGDILMVCCLNPAQPSMASETQIPTIAPYFYYKVKSRTSTSVTLDRTLPMIGSGTNISYAYVIKGGDAINDYYSEFEDTYWDYDNLSFETNDGNVANDVKVWNFNVVYKDAIIGLDSALYKDNKYIESKAYTGVLNIDDTLPKLKLFGLIHYTNNATTNTYGELFKRGSLRLTIPNVMYHRTHTTGNATTMGVKLVAVNDGDLDFDNLKDSVGNIVGRVYFKSQIIIITDEELTVALSYRGNRSWTLPKLNVNAVPSPTGATPFVIGDKELYVTYYFSTDTNTGFKNSYPCQAYSVLSNGIQGQDSAMIFFPTNQLPFLKLGFTATGSMSANKVFLLAQLVDKGAKPNPLMWKQVDITTTFKTVMGNLVPSDLEGKTYTLNQSVYESAPYFRLNDLMDGLVGLTSNDGLMFGEESVFMGALTVQPQAMVHKTSFSFPLLFNEFKHSKNPTYSNDGGRPVYVSEVGVYTENKELVIVGKTSKPLKKGDGDTILLQLDLDF